MQKSQAQLSQELQELINLKEAEFKSEVLRICEKFNGTVIPIISIDPIRGIQYGIEFKIKSNQ